MDPAVRPTTWTVPFSQWFPLFSTDAQSGLDDLSKQAAQSNASRTLVRRADGPVQPCRNDTVCRFPTTMGTNMV